MKEFFENATMIQHSSGHLMPYDKITNQELNQFFKNIK
jgi:ssRNA-specific RNase YbeY (16S rRNA maturation enzyme)